MTNLKLRMIKQSPAPGQTLRLVPVQLQRLNQTLELLHLHGPELTAEVGQDHLAGQDLGQGLQPRELYHGQAGNENPMYGTH